MTALASLLADCDDGENAGVMTEEARCPQVAPPPSGEIHGGRRDVNQPRDPGG
jgi:hypothetical protein